MHDLHKSKLNIGWLLIFLLSVIPIILWSLVPKLVVPFSNTQVTLVSLGELFGLVGMVLFSINFILATRLAFIERLFNGLNNVYKNHDVMGQLAFILLLFHPLLLLPRYASDFKEGISFLFLGDVWSRNFGIIALWTMIILIVVTLYLRPKYNLWKITHKFFGIVLLLGGLHVYLIPGYIMNNILLKIYVLGFVILGIVAFFYESVFRKYFLRTHQYIVENIDYLGEKIVEISLKSKNSQIDFRAGQFIFISFQQKGLLESHPFSISSAPNEGLLKITVKALGDFTEKIVKELKKGTITKIEGPYGVFLYDKTNNKNQIWIAGGVGITPFVSFIKDIIRKHSQFLNIVLFYCVRNEEEAIYFDFFKNIENRLSGFSVVPFYSQVNGRMDIKHIKKSVNNFSDNDFFICAPPTMIQRFRKDLIHNNIQKLRIYSEEFNF